MNGIPLRIAIVGGGTAGPAAAVSLRRLGHDVGLFERAPECRAVGAGFLLQPSGMEVLEELGIPDDVFSCAAKVDLLVVADGTAMAGQTHREMETGNPRFFSAKSRTGAKCSALATAMSGCAAGMGTGWSCWAIRPTP